MYTVTDETYKKIVRITSVNVTKRHDINFSMNYSIDTEQLQQNLLPQNENQETNSNSISQFSPYMTHIQVVISDVSLHFYGPKNSPRRLDFCREDIQTTVIQDCILTQMPLR